MTNPQRPFYYTQRFCIIAIFTVIATVIVCSASGIGPFHSQSDLHATRNAIEPTVVKDDVAKDRKQELKKTEPVKTEVAKAEEAKPATKTDTKAPEIADSKDSEKEAANGGDENRIRGITFNTIDFKMKKGETFERKMLTPAMEKLHDRRVSIGGFILPPGDAEITDGFFLTRDNSECCFGPGAVMSDRIYVVLKPEVVLKYHPRPVTVVGTFKIKYLRDGNDDLMSVFELSDVEVK